MPPSLLCTTVGYTLPAMHNGVYTPLPGCVQRCVYSSSRMCTPVVIPSCLLPVVIPSSCSLLLFPLPAPCYPPCYCQETRHRECCCTRILFPAPNSSEINPSSSPAFHGVLTRKPATERGVAQGCPLPEITSSEINLLGPPGL